MLRKLLIIIQTFALTFSSWAQSTNECENALKSIFDQKINQETIKNQEIIDQQNEIIHKQQREIEKLKKKLKQSNNI